MKIINFGIIGCGNVTEKKSGPSFNKIEGSNLLSVMRRDKIKLVDYAKRHNVPKSTTNYLEILNDENIHAVYIATPPNMHHFYTLEAAKHGKAVYVEKPMAISVKECEEMVEVCKENNVPLFVAYYRREQQKFKKIKELIEKNEIGEIRSFNCIYTSKMPEIDPERPWILCEEVSGGGMLYDVGSHIIDIMIYLFGDVDVATGISCIQSNNFEVNDVTSGVIKFKNNIQGSLQFTFNGNENRDEMIIIGSEGTLKFSVMSNEDLFVSKIDEQYNISFEFLEHVQLPFIKKIVNTLLGKDSYDISGIYGLRTQEILEAFNNSCTLVYSDDRKKINYKY